MAGLETIRVGPAGWNYKDWYGNVYPEQAGKDFKELDYLATFFDTAEINSTFYRPANAFMASSWVRKTSHNPRFKFTAKLWQRFTHDRTHFGPAEVKQVAEGMDPLAQAGQLGAILCQFPWSYKNDDAGMAWLEKVLDAFKEYPLAVEVRHASWDTPRFFEFLDKRDVGIAAIDQPVIGKSITLKPVRTGAVGYVRMHGRNYKTWFEKKQKAPAPRETPGPSKRENPSARYDYLYSEREIQEIADTVKAVAGGARETYVVQNNHPRGQAAANALQLRAALGETVLRAPESLIVKYPQLKPIVRVL
jgi:uncharacterized protein YecE (DUF72 family)